jgi:hypothetical protein
MLAPLAVLAALAVLPIRPAILPAHRGSLVTPPRPTSTRSTATLTPYRTPHRHDA